MADAKDGTAEPESVPLSAPPLPEILPQFTEEETEFLYSAICQDDEELRTKILSVQKRSYALFAYPCIRQFHFVSLFMQENEAYKKVLAGGQSGLTTFLDLGCCMGTEVRKLVADGYPAANVIGCDLRQEFIDFGFELYQDKLTCGINFFTCDIFDLPYPIPPSSTAAPPKTFGECAKLDELVGRITHCNVGAVFHLFSEHTQYVMALRVASLMKHSAGSIIFGRQEGMREAGVIPTPHLPGRYGHSPKTWEELWKHVFTEVESPEFAASHVVVQTRVADDWGRKTSMPRPGQESPLTVTLDKSV